MGRAGRGPTAHFPNPHLSLFISGKLLVLPRGEFPKWNCPDIHRNPAF
jgi:hypothetical protein